MLGPFDASRSSQPVLLLRAFLHPHMQASHHERGHHHPAAACSLCKVHWRPRCLCSTTGQVSEAQKDAC